MSNLVIRSLERNESWSKAQAKARAATCIIHVSNPDSFVSIGASISQGTGTLVDASRGIVLTCSRVIGNGPSLGHAVFGTKEYRIERLYSDPVHDFTFVKLLTKNGQIPEDLPEGINLHPEQAYQGCKICTVSNPGGQESNIGQGYISRTNSNVREWDFDECNTELMTAAMNCEGGSIGCSAINIQGNGLGIMIGFEGTVINLLPVDLPRKALERLQDDAPVNRGTLQVKWELKPLYECDRLQLGQEWLSRFEDEGVEYLVCAKVVLPQGPADGKVKPGHILLQLDDKLVTSLLQVDLYMDAHINEKVGLTLWNGSSSNDVECCIEDLHNLTPHHLIARQGTVFFNMDLLTAFEFNIPVKGVISSATFQPPFVGPSLIESIQGTAFSSSEAMATVFEANHKHRFITICFKNICSHSLSTPRTGYQLTIMDKPWFEMRRHPQQGGPWVITSMTRPTIIQRPLSHLQNCEASVPQPLLPDNDKPNTGVKEIFRATFSFRANRNIFSDGNCDNNHLGFGLVCDVKQGLAVVRRGTFSMFDEVTITINGRINISASVGFLHPALDLAVLKFDPVGIANAFMSDPTLTDNPLRQGDTVYHAPFGLSGNIINETQVENIDEDSAYRFHDDTSPFTAFSCTTCHLRIPPKTYQTEGILLNQDGTVAGLMLPSCAIIPSALIRSMIEYVRSGQVGKLMFRDFDVHRMLLADAFLQGLDRKWGEAITHKHVLCVGKVPIESPLLSSSMIKHPLRHGDIILKVEGLRVSTVSEVGFHYLKPVLSILLFRNGEEIEVEVPTLSLQDVTIDTVVSFCGSWLQKPPLATRMSGRPVHSQVYTTAFMKGGQADMFELKNGAFIVGVDGNTISTMADFVGHVAKIPFEKYFRVEFIPETQEHRVITMMKSVIGPTLLWRKLPSQNEEKVTVSVVDDEQWSQGWTLPRAKSERILLEPPKY
ncbi:hypothetical protein BDP55DRAFT_656763 [Colletotrichum godetiae]|uniref:Pro-apoptotic serine protease NMA111 n=1 Tax=Colletotrichum godetiae TaxID=1209918 RepID=A0AAJ0F0N3_9PEZI|nr:uncharacterized protein BDP55DRAFT_656763 [Colletotrichum godetiae]KAK1688678.1 hypothetical protein BDP55DRAFT_656763 [Colletotrichum godetiae]